MKIYSQYRAAGGMWGISLLTIFGSHEFWGFVLFGIVFEFERNHWQKVKR